MFETKAVNEKLHCSCRPTSTVQVGTSRHSQKIIHDKKKKASKQGKKKKKKKMRINVSEESKLSEHGEQVIDLGDSVMLSKEVAEPRQSGIMFYLRSDLGRALCLFIATIALAILTTRMQRQMEAEGI